METKVFHHYDIAPTKYLNEPLNTITSLLYFISAALVYKKNLPLSIGALLLGIGSFTMHGFDSKIGEFLDNYSMSIIMLSWIYQYTGTNTTIILSLLVLLTNRVRLGHALLVSLSIMMMVVASFKDLKVSRSTTIVFVLFLIGLTSLLELVRREYREGSYYRVVVFYGTLLLFLAINMANYNKTEGYFKSVPFKKGFFAIFLYYAAAMFQLGSRPGAKSLAPYNRLYHSVWHVITSYLIVYLADLLFIN